MSERHDIWKVADSLQMDLRAAQAKLIELRSMLAGLNFPGPSSMRCGICGLASRGPRTLAEHVYTSHGGPLPEHWSTIDSLANEGSSDTP